jgi:acetyl-CoA C-acetyltransferase
MVLTNVFIRILVHRREDLAARKGGLTLKVGIIGIGIAGFRTTTPELSWKELTYEAAAKAYQDADVDPRKDVKAFVTCAEDYWEGFGIFDEFTPDQIGGALRPVCTVCGDGIHGLATAFMQIQTGLVDVVAVEAHSKISDLLTYEGVVQHALDPIWNKPLRGHPFYVAGLEMNAFLRASGNTEKHCAAVVEKNRNNALRNGIAAYGANVDLNDILTSEKAFDPLKKLEISGLADGAVVLVLASDVAAKKLKRKPVWIKGVGWANDSPSLETREWEMAKYAELAAQMAYRIAKVKNPAREIDFAEVDDRFSYKELQHLESLGLAKKGQAGKMTANGDTALDGKFPVNASGGSLGCGDVVEASGLHRVAEVALQLRGDAGKRQLDGVKVGIAQSWRGIPTTSGAVAIMGVNQ